MWYRLAYGKPKLLINPIEGGFWVGDRFIDYREQFNLSELKKLLQTSNLNISTQEKLNSFLNNPDKFETINGKKIYLRNIRGSIKSLIIPFDFYIGDQRIEKDQVFILKELKKLLQTNPSNINTQEKLNSFLSDLNRFETINGKKIYLRNPTGRSKNLIIPFEFYVDDQKIEKDQVFSLKELIELLQTYPSNINTQEKLNSFLSDLNRFEIINGKKIYFKDTSKQAKSLRIPFDFYIDENKIEKDQVYTLDKLRKLLHTNRINVNTQEKLNSFLSDLNRFEIINGKKIYFKDTSKQAKSLRIPFDFYIDENKIEKDQVYTLDKLLQLLKTNQININTQEKLNSFLSDSNRFETIDGKKMYIKTPKGKNKNLIIPFDFYVRSKEIKKNEVYSVGELAKLLQTSNLNINTQEKLNYFLSNPDRFEIIDNKKIYRRNDKYDIKGLIIPFDFYVGDLKIEKDQVYNINELKTLLRTNQININTQEKLNSFLNSVKFVIDKNGNNQYFPNKKSLREKYINKNLTVAKEHNIVVESQKPITILNPGKSLKILKLDFAFIKDKNILLAIEVNGGQHYGFVSFSTKTTYEDWQASLKRDVEKINYCHNNNIPLLIFNHLLPEQYFRTIIDNLNKNPHMYDSYVPQSVAIHDENYDTADTSLEFIKRQIYSHLYPVFNGTISFDDDISKKRYIKDTLILIAKLLGIYNNGIDKTDYIKAFNRNVDLTENYNICLDIYNSLYPDYPLDMDEKITYNDLSVKPRINKPKEIEQNPLEI